MTAPRSGPERHRPRHNPSYVWCDFHCEIHGAQMDFYGEDAAADECGPVNWRKVFVNGTKGEFDL